MYGVSSANVERASSEGANRGWRDRNSQHGGSLSDTRNDLASAIELSVLKLGSRVTVLTGGRDVCEERLCVWRTFDGCACHSSRGIAGHHRKTNISKRG